MSIGIAAPVRPRNFVSAGVRRVSVVRGDIDSSGLFGGGFCGNDVVVVVVVVVLVEEVLGVTVVVEASEINSGVTRRIRRYEKRGLRNVLVYSVPGVLVPWSFRLAFLRAFWDIAASGSGWPSVVVVAVVLSSSWSCFLFDGKVASRLWVGKEPLEALGIGSGAIFLFSCRVQFFSFGFD